ncbi:unannotated protein [freshwater metagenome]|uniref:Unannotated protein n=1 Tax=freshwater metagenome TaxID=449393 RepID=A0A6J6K8Q4_9ZZZZ|nr:DUF4190 domain-containing protein [Actinomycetota bacterium]
MNSSTDGGSEQGFGQPQPGWPTPPSVQSSGSPDSSSAFGFAITSMVLGIVWVYWIGSILAVVFGHLALKQMKQSNNFRGKGFAIAGVALGWSWIGILTLIVVLAVVAVSTGS